MASTFTDIIVSNTANIASGNITNLQANNITANELICDSVTFDNLINTSNTLTLEGSVINIGNSGSQVNIIGSTTFIDTTNTNITDNLITLNKNGLSAVNSGIEIEDTGSIIASLKLDSAGDFIITSPNNKLTVDNITTTNITDVSTVSAITANLTTLNVSGNINVGTAGTSIHNLNSFRTFLNSTDVFLGGNNSTTDGILKYTKSAGKNYLQSSLTAVSGSSAPLLIGPYASGDTWAEFASTLVNIKKPLTSSSNLIVLGSSTQQAITCSTLNASGNITGTIATAAQPNITSVGTLTSLTTSGNITATASVIAGSMNASVNVTVGSNLFANGNVYLGSNSSDIVEIRGIVPGLMCSGAMTAGSLTVSGALNVDTNTLRVDSVNNRVGINNGSPSYPLDVIGTIKNNGDIISTGTVICTTLDATNLDLDTITSTTITNTGNITNTGDLTVNGNTTLGNATSDIISIPGTIRNKNNMIGYLFNNTGPASFPILCSIPSFNASPIYPDDALDTIIVYPGFKVIAYQTANYTGTATTTDATLSTVPIFDSTIAAGTNSISSMRVYYMTTEITITGLS